MRHGGWTLAHLTKPLPAPGPQRRLQISAVVTNAAADTGVRTWGGKTPEFIYKLPCTYSHMLKLKSPPKPSPFEATPLSRHFPLGSEQCLSASGSTPFGASAAFCFASSTSANRFPWRVFSPEDTKQSGSG